jgi:hypothetical protein
MKKKADTRVPVVDEAQFGPLATIRQKLAGEMVKVTGLTEAQLVK